MLKPITFALLAGFACVSLAEPLNLMGTETHTITLNNQGGNKYFNTQAPTTKKLTFMAFKLSDKAQQNLLARGERLALNTVNSLYRSQQLGMNGVPVLDQGVHGSCVTFAATAAVDAAFRLGDGISQLCQLELGSYLEKVSYAPSGWDGSFGHIVLNQMSVFGVVSKKLQFSEGCGGLKVYPDTNPDTPENQITPDEFFALQKSKLSFDPNFFWYPILHANHAFNHENDAVDFNKVLEHVKSSIDLGDRVVFGSLLVSVDDGVAGAVGKYRVANDSWILTDKLRKDMENTKEFAGHEMVITGYDDDASVTDSDGKVHKGLFTIRNSWSRYVGDHGNFYMSYEYFTNLVIEAHHIISK